VCVSVHGREKLLLLLVMYLIPLQNNGLKLTDVSTTAYELREIIGDSPSTRKLECATCKPLAYRLQVRG